MEVTVEQHNFLKELFSLFWSYVVGKALYNRKDFSSCNRIETLMTSLLNFLLMEGQGGQQLIDTIKILMSW